MTLAAHRGWENGGQARPAPEVLSRHQCLDLLRTVSVGRLGVSIDALPVILPVNFVVHNDAVVLRSVPGTKLDAALRQKVVAFEADSYSADGCCGWSVLVRGVAAEITDPDMLRAVNALPLRSWAYPTEADRWVFVATTMVSGRRFDHTSPAEG